MDLLNRLSLPKSMTLAGVLDVMEKADWAIIGLPNEITFKLAIQVRIMKIKLGFFLERNINRTVNGT